MASMQRTIRRMTVYRVENREGHGPYRGWRGKREAHWGSCNPREHLRPSPMDEAPDFSRGWWDLPVNVRLEYVFGFRTLRQFRGWFGLKAWKKCRRNGFRLVAYEVPDDKVLVGTWQVAFEYDAAVPVGGGWKRGWNKLKEVQDGG